MKKTQTVFIGIMSIVLVATLTACRSPNDIMQPTTGTVVGAVTFAEGATGSVTLELKTASGGAAYMSRNVTPDSTEVRFIDVTPGIFFLYAYVRGAREQLRYNVPVTAGGVYTLSGGITITICGCGLGTGDGCTGQCTDTVCGCGLGIGDGCTGQCTDTVCDCGLDSDDACDCAQTVVTHITLSHTGTLRIPIGESRIVYATVTPETAVFQWVEWTADNEYVSIARTPRPRAGIFAGPETAISISGNELGTATITATAMGSGPVEISATLTVEVVPPPLTVEIDGDVTMTMNWISPGTFMRGDHGEWIAIPVHQVTLTRGFYMGIHPVTLEQFYAVMDTDPSTSGGILAPGEVQERRPVENVNWYHAIAFANRLSIRQGLTPVYYIPDIDWATLEFADIPTTGNATWNAVTADWTANGFRLATEAEWEFAARARTTTQWSFGDTDDYIDYYAWTNRNSGGWRTRQVGQLRPNPWGLYDMHGNVWEWVWDWFGMYPSDAQADPTGPAAGVSRVLRGGSWDNPPGRARTAIRDLLDPDARSIIIGFRVVRP